MLTPSELKLKYKLTPAAMLLVEWLQSGGQDKSNLIDLRDFNDHLTRMGKAKPYSIRHIQDSIKELQEAGLGNFIRRTKNLYAYELLGDASPFFKTQSEKKSSRPIAQTGTFEEKEVIHTISNDVNSEDDQELNDRELMKKHSKNSEKFQKLKPYITLLKAAGVSGFNTKFLWWILKYPIDKVKEAIAYMVAYHFNRQPVYSPLGFLRCLLSESWSLETYYTPDQMDLSVLSNLFKGINIEKYFIKS